jgi:predicted acylesterase/phospholipase RssA
MDPSRLKLALSSVRLSVGRLVPVRAADPKLLVQQLRASAAVPIAFDAVTLPGPDGTPNQYVDGGVTANTPIATARALSSAVDVVLLSPPLKRQTFHNMVDITSGSFDTMQRRMMYDAIRIAGLETLLFRTFRTMPQDQLAKVATEYGYDAAEINVFIDALYDTNYYVLQPDRPLPATVLGFDDGASIRETYALGLREGSSGFKHFDPQSISM